MIATKEKTIDGVKYAVTQFPARKGIRLKHRLGRLAAPVLAPILSTAKGKSMRQLMDSDVDFEKIGVGLSDVLAKSNEDEFVDLVLALLQDTRREGREINEAEFDTAFAADYGHLYKVLGFVVKVNYSNLLAVVGDITVPEAVAETTAKVKSATS